MTKKILIAITTLICAGNIYAKDTTIFQCKTKNNKNVLVQLNNTQVSYRFGKSLSTPELAFSIPKNKASTYQWNGMKSDIYYDVNIPNGNITYTVYTSVDRSDHGFEAGIMVSKNDEIVATIPCNTNLKSFINNLEDVKLPSHE